MQTKQAKMASFQSIATYYYTTRGTQLKANDAVHPQLEAYIKKNQQEAFFDLGNELLQIAYKDLDHQGNLSVESKACILMTVISQLRQEHTLEKFENWLNQLVGLGEELSPIDAHWQKNLILHVLEVEKNCLTIEQKIKFKLIEDTYNGENAHSNSQNQWMTPIQKLVDAFAQGTEAGVFFSGKKLTEVEELCFISILSNFCVAMQNTNDVQKITAYYNRLLGYLKENKFAENPHIKSEISGSLARLLFNSSAQLTDVKGQINWLNQVRQLSEYKVVCQSPRRKGLSCSLKTVADYEAFIQVLIDGYGYGELNIKFLSKTLQSLGQINRAKLIKALVNLKKQNSKVDGDQPNINSFIKKIIESQKKSYPPLFIALSDLSGSFDTFFDKFPDEFLTQLYNVTQQDEKNESWVDTLKLIFEIKPNQNTPHSLLHEKLRKGGLLLYMATQKPAKIELSQLLNIFSDDFEGKHFVNQFPSPSFLRECFSTPKECINFVNQVFKTQENLKLSVDTLDRSLLLHVLLVGVEQLMDKSLTSDELSSFLKLCVECQLHQTVEGSQVYFDLLNVMVKSLCLSTYSQDSVFNENRKNLQTLVGHLPLAKFIQFFDQKIKIDFNSEWYSSVLSEKLINQDADQFAAELILPEASQAWIEIIKGIVNQDDKNIEKNQACTNLIRAILKRSVNLMLKDAIRKTNLALPETLLEDRVIMENDPRMNEFFSDLKTISDKVDQKFKTYHIFLENKSKQLDQLSIVNLQLIWKEIEDEQQDFALMVENNQKIAREIVSKISELAQAARKNYQAKYVLQSVTYQKFQNDGVLSFDLARDIEAAQKNQKRLEKNIEKFLVKGAEQLADSRKELAVNFEGLESSIVDRKKFFHETINRLDKLRQTVPESFAGQNSTTALLEFDEALQQARDGLINKSEAIQNNLQTLNQTIEKVNTQLANLQSEVEKNQQIYSEAKESYLDFYRKEDEKIKRLILDQNELIRQKTDFFENLNLQDVDLEPQVKAIFSDVKRRVNEALNFAQETLNDFSGMILNQKTVLDAASEKTQAICDDINRSQNEVIEAVQTFVGTVKEHKHLLGNPKDRAQLQQGLLSQRMKMVAKAIHEEKATVSRSLAEEINKKTIEQASLQKEITQVTAEIARLNAEVSQAKVDQWLSSVAVDVANIASLADRKTLVEATDKVLLSRFYNRNQTFRQSYTDIQADAQAIKLSFKVETDKLANFFGFKNVFLANMIQWIWFSIPAFSSFLNKFIGKVYYLRMLQIQLEEAGKIIEDICQTSSGILLSQDAGTEYLDEWIKKLDACKGFMEGNQDENPKAIEINNFVVQINELVAKLKVLKIERTDYRQLVDNIKWADQETNRLNTLESQLNAAQQNFNQLSLRKQKVDADLQTLIKTESDFNRAIHDQMYREKLDYYQNQELPLLSLLTDKNSDTNQLSDLLFTELSAWLLKSDAWNKANQANKTPLLMAIENNQMDFIRLWLDAFDDTRIKLCNKQDLIDIQKILQDLFEAKLRVFGADEQCWVELLLTHRVKIGITPEALHTYLRGAVVIEQNVEKVSFLLNYITDIDLKLNRKTLLEIITASEECNVEILNLFFKKNPDVNQTDSQHKTALYRAVENNNLILVKRLCQQEGIQVDKVTDKVKNTPLYCAFRRKPVNLDIVKALLDKGANLSVRNADEVMTYGGIDVADIKDSVTGDNLLHWAVKEKNIVLVQALLDGPFRYEKALHSVNQESDTALHLAVLANDRAIIQSLVQKKFISKANKNNFYPLNLAVNKGDLALVTYLVEECGQDVNQSQDPSLILSLYSQLSDEDISQTNPFAEKTRIKEVFNYLLPQGIIDLNQDRIQGKNLLHLAVEKNDTLMIDRLLIQRDIHLETSFLGDIGIDAVNDQGNTALHEAVLNHNQEAVKKLLEADAKVNVANEAGKTPLLLAIEGNKLGVLQHLQANIGGSWFPADVVNVQDVNGDTALHQAVKIGNFDIIKWLLNAGADPMLANRQGFTPFSGMEGLRLIVNAIEEAKLLLNNPPEWYQLLSKQINIEEFLVQNQAKSKLSLQGKHRWRNRKFDAHAKPPSTNPFDETYVKPLSTNPFDINQPTEPSGKCDSDNLELALEQKNTAALGVLMKSCDEYVVKEFIKSVDFNNEETRRFWLQVLAETPAIARDKLLNAVDENKNTLLNSAVVNYDEAAVNNILDNYSLHITLEDKKSSLNTASKIWENKNASEVILLPENQVEWKIVQKLSLVTQEHVKMSRHVGYSKIPSSDSDLIKLIKRGQLTEQEWKNSGPFSVEDLNVGHQVDHEKLTPLQYAIRVVAVQTDKAKVLDTLEFLIEKGSDINYRLFKDIKSNTFVPSALHMAIELRLVDVVIYLLQQPNVNLMLTTPDKTGNEETAFEWLAKNITGKADLERIIPLFFAKENGISPAVVKKALLLAENNNNPWFSDIVNENQEKAAVYHPPVISQLDVGKHNKLDINVPFNPKAKKMIKR